MNSGGRREEPAGRAARSGSGVPLLSEAIFAGQVTALRHTVAAVVNAAGLAGDELEDFVLAVHELVTNVVRHGGGTGRVLLWREGDLLVCEVSDEGPGLGDVAVALPPPGAVGHRGLWLAQQLTDGLVIDNSGQGTTARVRAQLPRSPA